MPHFFSLAWTYRADYRAAGMLMLSVTDPSGVRVARRSFIWCVLLTVAGVMPTLLGYDTWYYFAFASAMGVWILRSAFRFQNPANRDFEARRLFLLTLAYLPLLLGLLVADRFIFKL